MSTESLDENGCLTLHNATLQFTPSTQPFSEVAVSPAFIDACTPRPPKAEWFEKWNHWQVLDSTGNILHARITVIRPPDFRPGCECCCGPTLLCRVIGLDMPVAIDIENETVLPVAEKGPTIPIGWRAVGE